MLFILVIALPKRAIYSVPISYVPIVLFAILGIFQHDPYGSTFFTPLDIGTNSCDWTIQLVPRNFATDVVNVTMTTANQSGILSEINVKVTESDLFRFNICSSQRIQNEGAQGIIYQISSL